MAELISLIPPEILALIDKPLLLAAVLGIGALIGLGVEWTAADMRRREWRKRNTERWRKKAQLAKANRESWSGEQGMSRRPDATEQLRIVMMAEFLPQALLNKSEARVFRQLERILNECDPRWRVIAQVSLGEVLQSSREEAYGCVNSKRVDLLLIDADCRPRLAIEYQGGGHYQRSAAARDAVKKEALRRAGIGYHEVIAGHTTPAELRLLVERLVNKPKVTL